MKYWLFNRDPYTGVLKSGSIILQVVFMARHAAIIKRLNSQALGCRLLLEIKNEAGSSLASQNQWDFQGPPLGPILVPNPTPIRIPKDMGIVWEVYHKGVLGSPGNHP